MKTCSILMLLSVTLAVAARVDDSPCASGMCALPTAATNAVAAATDAAKAAVPVAVAVAKPQTLCPVMAGETISKKLYVDYDGKRIYVCCKGCLAAVRKDPAKYVKQLEASGVTLESVPENQAK